ncbi:hypothetical protein J2125_004768 [Erwinia toletana]|uniref:Uncharacterized protein n=1 Tax=Winslowiella toletana TaxID=92490 RepID=A0ABS4PG12_9GAMM|nr:hypothetical protein [Winslowiella toletana]
MRSIAESWPIAVLFSATIRAYPAIAWMLQRSDILAYDHKGELKFGLSYPDAQSRYVSGEGFRQWLSEHRHQGNISLVLMLERGEKMPANLPVADDVYRNDRMLFLQYHAKQ